MSKVSETSESEMVQAFFNGNGGIAMLKEIKCEEDAITNVDLFNEIVNVVKKSGKWPEDIIEYADSCASSVKMYNCDFSPIFNISEGSDGKYYLDLDIQGNYGLKEEGTVQLGSIKMFYTSNENIIRQIAALYGECVIAYKKVMRDNFDAFNRIGYDIYFVNEEHARAEIWNLTVSSIEEVFHKYVEFYKANPKKYHTMVVRDNLTRESYCLGKWRELYGVE